MHLLLRKIRVLTKNGTCNQASAGLKGKKNGLFPSAFLLFSKKTSDRWILKKYKCPNLKQSNYYSQVIYLLILTSKFYYQKRATAKFYLESLGCYQTKELRIQMLKND